MDWAEALRRAQAAMSQGQPFTGYNQMGPPQAGGPTFGSSGGAAFGGGAPPPGGGGGSHPFNQFVPGANQPAPGGTSMDDLLALIRTLVQGSSAGGGMRGFG